MRNPLKPIIIPATLADYPIVEDMVQFYFSDLLRYMQAEDVLKKNAAYFKTYFENPSRITLLLKINKEIVGCAFVNSDGFFSDTEFNMGEFFVLSKFQGQGIGQQAVEQIWNNYPGRWEVPVIPENKPALAFWRKNILNFTSGNYLEKIKKVNYDNREYERVVFSFNSRKPIK
jgi:predicted acetyltransferase